jgi:hypothetical protein
MRTGEILAFSRLEPHITVIGIIWKLLENPSQMSRLLLTFLLSYQFVWAAAGGEGLDLNWYCCRLPAIGGHNQSVDNHWKSVIVIGCGD